jgi:hypothetical protein
MSVRSLMDLTALANTSSVTHEDVLRLLNPSPALDASVALLARLVRPHRPTVAGSEVSQSAPGDAARWIYVVREGTLATDPPISDVLTLTVGPGEMPGPRRGDALAFLVPSRGIVARARVLEVRRGGDGEAEDADMRYAVHLAGIEILDPPIRVGTEQRLNLELQAAVSQEPCVRVRPEEFDALTRAREGAAAIESDVVAEV